VIAGEDAVTGDDVADLGRVEPRAGGQRSEALGEEVLRVDAVQGAVGPTSAARRANGVEDPGVDTELPSLRASWCPSRADRARGGLRELYSSKSLSTMAGNKNAFSRPEGQLCGFHRPYQVCRYGIPIAATSRNITAARAKSVNIVVVPSSTRLFDTGSVS
jgi:hypothetical protein